MKIIRLSTKVQLIRHWFVWYRVTRAGTQWQRIDRFTKKQLVIKDEDTEDPADPIDSMSAKEAQRELEKRITP